MTRIITFALLLLPAACTHLTTGGGFGNLG